MQNNKWIQELAETYREMLAEYMFTLRHSEQLKAERRREGKPDIGTELIQNMAQNAKGEIKPAGRWGSTQGFDLLPGQDPAKSALIYKQMLEYKPPRRFS